MKKVFYIFMTICLLLASLAIGCQSSGEQANKISSLGEQLNNLQTNITTMEKTISELQQRVESLEKENLKLRGVDETTAAKTPQVAQTTTLKDIEALNWLVCVSLGMPYDYTRYLTNRFGPYAYKVVRGQRYMTVEFGDGTTIDLVAVQ